MHGLDDQGMTPCPQLAQGCDPRPKTRGQDHIGSVQLQQPKKKSKKNLGMDECGKNPGLRRRGNEGPGPSLTLAGGTSAAEMQP